MRALISVSDKTNLVEFASQLVELGFEIIATGGTKKALDEANIKTIYIEDVTGFPEILDGRVKTLHPAIHGGLLAKRDNKSHMEALAKLHIETIDLLCVNLYPFKQTIKSIMTTQEPDNYVLTNMYSTSYEVEGNDAVIVEILACNKLKVVKKDNYYLINNEDKLYYNISKEYSDALGILITKEKIIVLDGSYLYFNNNVLLESREKSNYIIEVKDEIFK